MISEKSVSPNHSTIGISVDVIFQENFFKDMNVREYENDINSPNVGVENFSSETRIIKHFFP
jgi:hypothetical protein